MWPERERTSRSTGPSTRSVRSNEPSTPPIDCAWMSQPAPRTVAAASAANFSNERLIGPPVAGLDENRELKVALLDPSFAPPDARQTSVQWRRCGASDHAPWDHAA